MKEIYLICSFTHLNQMTRFSRNRKKSYQIWNQKLSKTILFVSVKKSVVDSKLGIPELMISIPGYISHF